MKISILFFILFSGACSVSSQNQGKETNQINKNEINEPVKVFKKKNVLKDVKAYYKAANFSKANETIQKAFKDYPDTHCDPDLLGYEMNIQYQLYQAENRKLYLNGKGDTVKLFSYIYETYNYGLKCDSVSRIPDKKGKIITRYFSDANHHLSSLRNNLKSGGLYYLKNKKYPEALSYFNIYIQSINNPIVYKAKDGTIPSDTDSVKIYKMAVHAAYGTKCYKDVMRLLPIALSDTIRKDVVIEMGAESALQLNDSSTFVQLLNAGFEDYPQNDYFRANLIKLYHNHNDFNNTIKILNKCIETDSLDAKYWKLKGNEYYSRDSIEAAIDPYQHVVEIDKNDAETFSKLGNIYIRKARDFYNNANLKISSPDFTKNRLYLTELYINAMNYYERARDIQPNHPELWKNGLRETYYKLNKGKELKLLEEIK